jgi:hypothetical protein
MPELNPYESPKAAPSEGLANSKSPQSPREMADRARIVRNIRAICLLYIVFGTIFLITGISLLVGEKNAGTREIECAKRGQSLNSE